MVTLAERMRQKLLSGTNSQAGGESSNDEDMGSKQEMQDWLLSVGIISPVTKESAGAQYHQQLSRQVHSPSLLSINTQMQILKNHFRIHPQVADFVKIPLERAGGMINMIDVYCLFNRARGTGFVKYLINLYLFGSSPASICNI